MFLKQQLADIEEFLRNGQIVQASNVISEINLKKVPREYRFKLANFCRRSGLFSIGLGLLGPIIYRDWKEKSVDAKAYEVSEYASLLMKVGSITEARSLLLGLNSKECPERHLYLGFCDMNEWNYSSAIGHFENFIAISNDDYQILLAQLNRAAALIHTDDIPKATDVIKIGYKKSKMANYKRLTANFLELTAQIEIENSALEKASEFLSEAERILGPSLTNDQLYLLKWRAVIESHKRHSLLPIKNFKDLAIRRGDWESVREADLQMLKIDFKQSLFDYLFWGSVSNEFKKRLLHLGNPSSEIQYYWGGSRSNYLDLKSGISTNGKKLDVGLKIHQLICCISRDFYNPAQIGGIFSDLFPGEHFHFNHSINRVHQLLFRTRNWFRNNKIPVSVVYESGRVYFQLGIHFSLRIEKERSILSQSESKLLKIKNHFKDRSFSSADLQLFLEISEPTARRLIQENLQNEVLAKKRVGRKVSYFFT